MLRTTDDAIRRWGGPTKFARRLSDLSGKNVTPQRVNNWRTAEIGTFPHWTAPFLIPEFKRDGIELPLPLFGLASPERRRA